MSEQQPEAPAIPGVTRQTLMQNDWVSLMIVRKPEAGVNGYVYSHETRCRGRIVAVLPYRAVALAGRPVREYLVKSEMTPCWGFDQVLSAITGGYEGGGIEDDAVREMLEETGYAITRDELIPLGTSFASKSADTVYSLFSVDLTGREAGEAIGDGARLEAESAAVWVDAVTLATLSDPQLAVMCMRIPGVCEPAPEPLIMPADEFAATRTVAEALTAVRRGLDLAAPFADADREIIASAREALRVLGGEETDAGPGEAIVETLEALPASAAPLEREHVQDLIAAELERRAEAAEAKLAAIRDLVEAGWPGLRPSTRLGSGTAVQRILAITGTGEAET
jgi:8-oxo-dGTP pyrophosphatase MutT (NUDIX family)